MGIDDYDITRESERDGSASNRMGRLNLFSYATNRCAARSGAVWGHLAPGHVVGAASGGFPGLQRLHCVFNLGGLSGQRLLVWAVYFAHVFARAFRYFPSRLVRRTAVLVSVISSILGGVPDPLGAWRLQNYVLLLSRCVLQSLLGGS